MKWITTFSLGALVGAIGLALCLRSSAPDPAPVAVALPAVVAPAAIVVRPVPAAPIAARAMPAPSPVETILPDAAVPESALIAGAPMADQLLIPVAGISASELNDTFDEARGTDRRHQAIDILAPKGTPVFAVANGTVAKLFDSVPGGLTIYQFDPSEHFAYYYAHLDRYAAAVKQGMVLKRGDLIGYVGTTGNADPAAPHLHFAIFVLGPEKQWWKGTPVNPYPLLGGATRAGVTSINAPIREAISATQHQINQ